MVGNTDMYTNTQKHIGKASDSSEISVWAGPNMYGPAYNMSIGYVYSVCVWGDHTCMGQPIRAHGQNIC